MNIETAMRRWLPCQSRCALAGAAAFFLSIEGSAVLINGPRWCAVVAEREMAAVEKKYEQQLFCSEMKEITLLFGADDSMASALAEIRQERQPTVVAVLNSCSVSLIGDDLKGICKTAQLGCPVIPLDSGGLVGEFWQGYQLAGQKLLEEARFAELPRIKHRVNIIGWCTSYPNWEGDLREIKRLLRAVGIEVGVCLGADGMRMEELAALPKAALNLVLYPELGLPLAQYLQTQTGQPYLLAPVPYGQRNSLHWLLDIAAALQLPTDVSALEAEIADNQEKIDTAVFALKAANRHIGFGDAWLCVTQGMGLGLCRALLEEFPDLHNLYLRLEGPQQESLCAATAAVSRKWESYTPVNGREEYIDLLFGNTQTRVEAGNYRRMVFINLLPPMAGLTVRERPYAGIAGWKFLLADIFEQFQTLSYINPRRRED